MRSDKQRVVVWDALIRLFHWGLVGAVAISFYTTKTAGSPFLFPIEVHAQAGYIIIGLLIFRILWGVLGSVYARFSTFLYSPKHTVTYIKQLVVGRAPSFASHNPLGGWMVVILLLSLGFQAISGLFLSDDIFFQGPFNELIGRDATQLLSRLHTLNSDLLIILISVHIVAQIVHKLMGERLVTAMVTGVKYVKHLPADLHTMRKEKYGLSAFAILLIAIGMTGWLWFY